MDTKEDMKYEQDALPLHGISPEDPFVLPRTKLIDKILAAGSRLLVTAPPGGGKSSLAFLLRAKLESQKIPVLYRVITNPGPENLKRMNLKPRKWLNELFGRDFEEALRSYSVILLDDAQGLFSAPDIWNFLVKSCEPVQIIFFASVLPESCDVQTSVITWKIGWNDLKLDKEEQDELCAKMVARYASLTWFPEMLAMVRRDAGGHVGLLRLIPQHLVNNHPRDIKNDEEFVTFMHRFYFGAMFDTWPMHRFFRFHERLNATHREILHEMIFRGGVSAPPSRDSSSPPDSKEIKAKRELLRLVIVAQVGPTLEFATPFHFRYFFRAAFPSFISDADFEAIPNLPSWCPFVIGRFQQSAFQGGDFPLEGAIQHMFWKAASECIPSSYRLAAEVSKTYGGATDGRLDFWVNSKLQWAIELVREGDRQREHLERFGVDGKYFSLQPKEWVVIDFRNPRTNIGRLEGKPNLINVVFSADFSFATLVVGVAKAMVRVELRK